MSAVPLTDANVKTYLNLILNVTRKIMISRVQVTRKNITWVLILVHMAVVMYMHVDAVKNASMTGSPTMLVTSSMMGVNNLHVITLMKPTVMISLSLVTLLVTSHQNRVTMIPTSSSVPVMITSHAVLL